METTVRRTNNCKINVNTINDIKIAFIANEKENENLKETVTKYRYK